MLTVSDGFKQAIVAPNRLVRANVHLEVLDTDAWLDNEKVASSHASISRLEQVTNRVRRTQGAMATFEPNRWRLDGSFVIPPQQGELPEAEVGWWGDNFCDADGYFNPSESVVITCGALYNAAGLTITFDPAGQEWGRDFTVTVYGEDDVVIHQEQVIDHNKATYMVNRNLPRFYKVDISIARWSAGHRRAKLLEVDFGFVEDYGAGNLISLSTITEIDPTGATLPAGELRFKLDNSDRRFDILNPTGLYYFLQQRQRVTVTMGVEVNGVIENVPAGTYYLSEWKSDHGTLTASFTARDAIDLLAQGTYRKGRLAVMSVYDLIVDIIEDAGASIPYTIDEALQSVLVLACVPIVSHRDALQFAAMAGRAVVRASKQGMLLVERLATGAAVDIISMKNMFKSPSIKLNPLINAVRVNMTSYQTRRSEVEVYNGVVEIDGPSEIWLEYSSPCQNHQVTLTGGMLDSAEHYAYASRLLVSGAGQVSVKVVADEMESHKAIYELRDDERPAGEPAYALEISNPLINTQTVAADVAMWMMEESGRRLDYDIDWQQNPALECGDLVIVEDEFGGNKTARITKQELKYAGYLEGRTGAKGGGR